MLGRVSELTQPLKKFVKTSSLFFRSIPDTRLEECKYWHYPGDLPKASVVIVFHNEGKSVLLRTVHSVINRTPSQFLEEVLLGDDFSDKPDLGQGLFQDTG